MSVFFLNPGILQLPFILCCYSAVLVPWWVVHLPSHQTGTGLPLNGAEGLMGCVVEPGIKVKWFWTMDQAGLCHQLLSSVFVFSSWDTSQTKKHLVQQMLASFWYKLTLPFPLCFLGHPAVQITGNDEYRHYQMPLLQLLWQWILCVQKTCNILLCHAEKAAVLRWQR